MDISLLQVLLHWNTPGPFGWRHPSASWRIRTVTEKRRIERGWQYSVSYSKIRISGDQGIWLLQKWWKRKMNSISHVPSKSRIWGATVRLQWQACGACAGWGGPSAAWGWGQCRVNHRGSLSHSAPRVPVGPGCLNPLRPSGWSPDGLMPTGYPVIPARWLNKWLACPALGSPSSEMGPRSPADESQRGLSSAGQPAQHHGMKAVTGSKKPSGGGGPCLPMASASSRRQNCERVPSYQPGPCPPSIPEWMNIT